MKHLEPIAVIDMHEIQEGEDYLHIHICMKSLNRWLKKQIKRTAPDTGIVLVSRDMMNKIL